MNQNEFASELTKQGLPALMDAKTLAAQALARNRRRIRTLATLTILLWVLDILLIPSVMMPLAAKFNQQIQLLSSADQPGAAPVTVEMLAKIMREVLQHVTMVSAFVVATMLLASLLAAICTIRLVLIVRRVTLEQLAIGLAQISEQLKRLESMGAK